MFKKSFLTLSLITLSGVAMSAPIANLKVQGSIAPPTCNIQGLDEVDVLYTFNITPELFLGSANLPLTSQTKNIQVVCDAVTYLAFDALDNRADTELATGNNNFGLGTYDMEGIDTKIGYYTVTMKNATVQQDSEGEILNVGVLTGTTYATTGLLDKSQTTAWATSSSVLAPGEIFAADFEVRPTINGELKNSGGDAALDGHAVLAFKFGV